MQAKVETAASCGSYANHGYLLGLTWIRQIVAAGYADSRDWPFTLAVNLVSSIL